MKSAKDKILLFNEIVLKDAFSERDQILNEIKAETEKDISKTKAECEKLSMENFLEQSRKVEEEKNKIIHEAFGRSRLLLDKTRQEIISLVINEVKKMMEEYRSTDHYYEYIIRSIQEFTDENKGAAICVYLLEEDLKKVSKRFPGLEFKMSKDINGGVIIENMDSGVLKDNSFTSKIEKYKDIFMEGL